MPDTTPGDGALKRYWTEGKGLALWSTTPHPWTTLRDLLAPHVGLHKATLYASRWFFEVFGYYSGSRKGNNPVGPG